MNSISKLKIKIFLFFLLFFIFTSSFSFLYAACSSCGKDDPLCGPKSLLVVCNKLKVQTNIEELKQLSGYDETQGTTMAGLYKAAQAKGLYAEGMKLSIEELSKLKIPIIAYFWENHCVVIDGFKGDKLTIIDYPQDPYSISKEEFANYYSGFAILVAKNKRAIPKIETKGPDIRFNEYTYDFGKADEGKEIEHIFKFKNAGKEELIITEVRTSCGCTATVLSDKNILPEGEGEIKATFNTTNYIGSQDHKIYVLSNDSVTPLVKLQVKGVVKKGLIVTPSNISFGSVQKGTLATRKLYIIESEGEKLNILKTQSSSEYISIKVSRSTEAHRKGFLVDVALKSDIPVGRLEEKITIYTTSEKYPKIEIPVTVNIKGDIEFRPNTFFFGIVHPVRSSVSNGANKGDTPSSKVTIFTTSNDPLKLEKIDCPFDYISVIVTPKVEGKEYELTAILKDNAPTGTIKGNITIYTNNPDQPKIEIPVYGLIRE